MFWCKQDWYAHLIRLINYLKKNKDQQVRNRLVKGLECWRFPQVFQNSHVK